MLLEKLEHTWTFCNHFDFCFHKRKTQNVKQKSSFFLLLLKYLVCIGGVDTSSENFKSFWKSKGILWFLKASVLTFLFFFFLIKEKSLIFFLHFDFFYHFLHFTSLFFYVFVGKQSACVKAQLSFVISEIGFYVCFTKNKKLLKRNVKRQEEKQQDNNRTLTQIVEKLKCHFDIWCMYADKQTATNP